MFGMKFVKKLSCLHYVSLSLIFYNYIQLILFIYTVYTNGWYIWIFLLLNFLLLNIGAGISPINPISSLLLYLCFLVFVHKCLNTVWMWILVSVIFDVSFVQCWLTWSIWQELTSSPALPPQCKQYAQGQIHWLTLEMMVPLSPISTKAKPQSLFHDLSSIPKHLMYILCFLMYIANWII